MRFWKGLRRKEEKRKRSTDGSNERGVFFKKGLLELHDGNERGQMKTEKKKYASDGSGISFVQANNNQTQGDDAPTIPPDSGRER